MWLWVFSSLSLLIQDDSSPPVLARGQTIEDRIEQHDGPIESPRLLEAYEFAERRGRRFRIDLDRAGTFTIDLRALGFDAYLVLRDEDGKVLRENDNARGLQGTQARIVLNFQDPPATFLVDACALSGFGPFHLSLSPEPPPDLSAVEALSLAAREARDALDAARDLPEPERSYSLAHAWTVRGSERLMRGAMAEARDALARAAALCEQLLGPDDVRTAVARRNLSLVVEGLGDWKTARSLDEQALEVILSRLGPDHRETAFSRSALASVLEELGEYDAACELYEQALPVIERFYGPQDRELAYCLNNLVQVYRKLERLQPALKAQTRVVEILSAINDPAVPIARSNLAEIQTALLDLDAAEANFREARERVVATLGESHPWHTQILNSLALLLIDLDRLDEARGLLEEALRVDLATPDVAPIALSRDYHNLALVSKQLGLPEEALNNARRAVELLRTAAGPSSPQVARSEGIVALALASQGRVEEALPLYDHSLEVLRRVLGDRHHVTVAVRGNRTQCLVSMGRVAEAEDELDVILADAEQALGEEHPYCAAVRINRGWLYYQAGEPEQALELYERSRATTELCFGAGHSQVTKLLGNSGLALLELGEPERALERFLESMSRTVTHLKVAQPTLSRAERFVSAQHAGEWLSGALSALDLAGGQAEETAVYEAVLAWKGKVLRSLLAGPARPEPDKETRERRAALQRAQAELSKVWSGDLLPEPGMLDRLRRERDRLERELQRSVEPPGGLAAADFATLSSALPEGVALVDFLVHHVYGGPGGDSEPQVDWGPPVLTAWVTRAGETAPRRVSYGAIAPLEDLAREALARLQPSPPPSARDVVPPRARPAEAREPSALQRLYLALWRPLETELGDAAELVVCPDGFLQSLPFEIMQPEAGRFLIERHAFTYLEELASLPVLLGKRRPRDSSLVCMGGVEFASASGPLARSLPGTEREARSILGLHRERFGEKAARIGLFGPEGSEARLKRELPGHAFIHLATHGYSSAEERIQGSTLAVTSLAADHPELLSFARSNPELLSGLVCAGGSKGEDGLLTAEEVRRLDLRSCALVVLSACRTGLGPEQAGEGLAGLERALREAGARSVISSLWSVPDAATAELMEAFYERLWRAGLPPGRALQEARLELLEKGRHGGDPTPFRWGGFVLKGDWR